MRWTTVAASTFASVMVGSLTGAGTPAWAAGGHGGGGGGSTTPTGIDISYPQCSASLPSGQAFVIVGVNGGLANDYNSCLAAEFAYASATVATTKQAAAQTYLNTADPGNSVADWPSPAYPGAAGSASNPYGVCDAATTTDSSIGADDTKCAWDYGYDMVAGISVPSETIPGDLAAFHLATGKYLYSQPVWLDVETTNSWQTNLAMNTADLQGMLAAVGNAAKAASVPVPSVGIYTTAYQWGQIIGSSDPSTLGSLSGLPEWVPGARRESAAVSNCTSTSYTGGTVTLTQWTATFDYDYSCTG